MAGLLLIALVVWELWAALTLRFELRTSELVGGMLSVAAGVFAVVVFFTGSVDVDVANVVSVGVEDRQWRAYVGLVLGIGLFLVGAARVLVLWSSRTRLTSGKPRHGVA